MAKFKFQLEAVERVRIQKEQKKLEELSAAQRVYQEKITIKKQILQKKEKAVSHNNSLNEKKSTINEFRDADAFIQGLKLQTIRADQAIVRARRFLEQAMKQYVLARRERMMIDRMKEKALEEFKFQQARLEQKSIDDLITMRIRLTKENTEEEEIAS